MLCLLACSGTVRYRLHSSAFLSFIRYWGVFCFVLSLFFIFVLRVCACMRVCIFVCAVFMYCLVDVCVCVFASVFSFLSIMSTKFLYRAPISKYFKEVPGTPCCNFRGSLGSFKGSSLI